MYSELENRRVRKGTVGSNPTLSANKIKGFWHPQRVPFFLCKSAFANLLLIFATRNIFAPLLRTEKRLTKLCRCLLLESR
jgi:hypothetical protein